MHSIPRAAFLLLLSSALAATAQQPAPTTAAEAPTRDTSFIDAQGNAHISRIIPVPQALSFQSVWWLSRVPFPRGVHAFAARVR